MSCEFGRSGRKLIEKLKWLVLRLREEQQVQAWQLQFVCSLMHGQSWTCKLCVWQELRCSSMVSSSAQKDPSRFETQVLQTPDAESGEADDKAAAKVGHRRCRRAGAPLLGAAVAGRLSDRPTACFRALLQGVSSCSPRLLPC